MELWFDGALRLARWTWVLVAVVYVVVVQDIQFADGKRCVKREEIGDRPGNIYKCEDPVRTECCEKNRTFTCCEPYWSHAMTNQLWLLVAVAVVALIMVLVVCWCWGQTEFFKAPTAKDAMSNFRDKFLHTFHAFPRRKKDRIGTELQPKSNYTTVDSTAPPMGWQRDQE